MKTALALVLSLGIPSFAFAEASRPADPPFAVFSVFTEKALPELLEAARCVPKRHPRFGNVPVFLGQYGISKKHDQWIHDGLRLGRYAPILEFKDVERLCLPREAAYADLAADQKERLSRGGHVADAVFPKEYQRSLLPCPEKDLHWTQWVDRIGDALWKLSDSEARAWGVELGRRHRDAIRAKPDVRLDAWQLDEIPSQIYKHWARVRWRHFMAGQLDGLSNGRPGLDKRFKGLIAVARPEFLPEMSGPGTEELFGAMERASLAILGEEYPKFEGDPNCGSSPLRCAEFYGKKQSALARRGGNAAKLARKYVPLLTPGFHVYDKKGNPTGLWGDVGHRGHAFARVWRNHYVKARVKFATAGLGEYFFVSENDDPEVIIPAVDAVACAATLLKGGSCPRTKPSRCR